MSQISLAGVFRPGDSAISNGLVQTAGGDYVLAGRVFEESGDSEAAAIRVDPSANVVWQKIYTSAFTVFFKAVDRLAGGELVATGSFFYSEFAGDEYIWVVRLNPLTGEIVWQEAFGSRDEQSDGEDVTAAADGGYVVAGLFLVKETGISGTRVIKFDADNNVQWDMHYETGVAFDIRQTRDGGYILTGARNIPDSLNRNIFVLRLDAEGNVIWEKVYTDLEIYVLLDAAIAETDDCNFIVAAKSVIMKIDCSGNVIWAHQSVALNLGSVITLPDRNFAVGGSLIVNNFDHAYVAALGPEGLEILWDDTEIPFPSGVSQIILNREERVAGTGYLPVNKNESEMFLAVYDPAGTIVTAQESV